MNWQPIKEFFKSHHEIVDVWVTWYDMEGIRRGRRWVNVWHDGQGFVYGKEGLYLRGVTHFMIRPKPPEFGLRGEHE